MTWDEVKNSLNEPLWGKFAETYFWVLVADELEKSIKVRTIGGYETTIFYFTEEFSII